ncbi:MAG: DUF4363 family protein [Oscillospiraceae bacterium]|jgi:hypothetical protein|nr:DUF4363 family protein [Oscillospiraceae bacterium]
MRQKRWILAGVLLAVLALGSFTMSYAGQVAQGMLTELAHIQQSIESAAWPRAAAQAADAQALWQRKAQGLDLFINHRQTEAVEAALGGVAAGARARDAGAALVKLAEAKAILEHLPRHETPTLGNII